MPTITPDLYESMGLNKFEYDRILELLGREPTQTELGMFAVMWSEHCGYKYSRPVLALFKKYKEALEGKGLENAGVVDIGEGLGVTMKIESHNHPSAVEPYQGAATGVGGIIRDILTMGARPIASLNSLRFGTITKGHEEEEMVHRNRYLFEHVVAGIGGYGNCVGVPTVAGEVSFHKRYSGNPLVNAMCVGILKTAEITTAEASGDGNPVLYLGSATGKDGIHGATFASDALGEDNQAKRPNVQIGDPFAEKLLIEATLEALQTGAIVAIQDMGAAGLTCSITEMAGKGKVGMDVSLDLVPMRENDMTAYELMLSESQERMLAVAEKGREQEVIDVFEKWGLHARVIGKVNNRKETVLTRFGKEEARVDASLLTDQCPTYVPEAQTPEYFRKAGEFDVTTIKPAEPLKALKQLLGCPNIASKRRVFQQYDQQVGTQTVLVCGEGDAAVLAPRGTHKGIALKVDGNGRQVYLDPYVGAQLAVVEAARNVACTGAVPTAITDGLNFGNPQKPHVYWQFAEAVRGLAEAAEAMETPVISGNVSFYNESDLGEVLPTPLVGMLGVLEHARDRIGIAPKSREGLIGLLYTKLEHVGQEGLGASEYLAEVHNLEDGRPVAPNLNAEKLLCALLARAAAEHWIEAAHDLSEGGLAVAAAEIAIIGRVGIEIDAQSEALAYSSRPDAVLFGELPGRVLVCIGSDDSAEKLKTWAKGEGLGFELVGRFTSGERLLISPFIDAEVEKLCQIYEGSIEEIMREEPQ